MKTEASIKDCFGYILATPAAANGRAQPVRGEMVGARVRGVGMQAVGVGVKEVVSWA